MKEKWAKFKYWFVNVFLYHYKWTPWIILFILFMVFVLTSDLFKGMDADYEIVLTSQYYITDEQLTEISDTLSEEVGDLNGDGYEYSPVVVMNLTDQLEENTRMKLVAYFSTGDAVLFIMDELTADDYMNQDVFEPLESFGLTPTEDNPYMIRVDQYPVFDRAGLKLLADRTDLGYFACFMKITDEFRNDPEMMQRYDYAVSVLNKLLEME